MVKRVSPRQQGTGIRWDRDAVPFEALPAVGVPAALDSLRVRMVRFVHDAAALEGNALSVSEMAELVDGGPTGPLTFDEVQVISLGDAFALLDKLVRDGRYMLDKATSDRLHATVAEHEAIESGHFRGEGRVGGGGFGVARRPRLVSRLRPRSHRRRPAR